MRKVVINRCFGGFGLSVAACARLLELEASGVSALSEGEYFIGERDNPLLVQVVEELGHIASDSMADLRVVEIPDDVEWEIKEYDGNEHIAEVHRTWR